MFNIDNTALFVVSFWLVTPTIGGRVHLMSVTRTTRTMSTTLAIGTTITCTTLTMALPRDLTYSLKRRKLFQRNEWW